jgi:predicted Zn-dependent protease
MKRFILIWALVFCTFKLLLAQDNDMMLARQYTSGGEYDKALEIYQKLYKQNQAFYTYYVQTLISLKKLAEAESTIKKLIKKHPGDYQYIIVLGKIYIEQGNNSKAEALYNDMIKNLPTDQGEIANLATQLYQAENTDIAIRIFQQGRKVLHNDQLYAMELISLYRYKKEKIALVEEYLNFLPANPVYLSQSKNAFSSIFEGANDYDMLKAALLKRIQKEPEQVIYTDLLTWQFLQQKDYEQALNQTLALSRRQNDNGNSVYDLCQTLLANEAYDAAIRGYEYVVSRNTKDQPLYIPAKVELINAKNKKITSGKYITTDLLGLEKDYNDLLGEFGRNDNTAFAMQQLARLQAYKLHKLAEAQKVLESVIEIPNLRPTILAASKLDLGDIYLLTNQPWEATLVYSQVEKGFPNTSSAEDAKYRNAKLAYYTGDFKWAKSQLDILKAATSHLIANDALNLSLMITDNTTFDTTGNALKMYAHADLMILKEDPAAAIRTLDSIDSKYPGNSLTDDILMAKARIFIQQKNYTAAIVPLKAIADENAGGLWSDDATYMLGDIFESQLGDKVKAKQYYQKIITDYPGSLWINEARKRFRILRGDQQNTSS